MPDIRALSSLNVRAAAASQLRRLGKVTGQTVHLAALEGGEVLYVDKFESTQAIRRYSSIGARAPLHCTRVAKAIVSFRRESERRALAERTRLHE